MHQYFSAVGNPVKAAHINSCLEWLLLLEVQNSAKGNGNYYRYCDSTSGIVTFMLSAQLNF
jgi:hypothetical protein